MVNKNDGLGINHKFVCDNCLHFNCIGNFCQISNADIEHSSKTICKFFEVHLDLCYMIDE